MSKNWLPLSLLAFATAIVYATSSLAVAKEPVLALNDAVNAKVACVRIAASTEKYTEEGLQKLVTSGRTDIIVIHKKMVCGW
jgi:hypothetical protein